MQAVDSSEARVKDVQRPDGVGRRCDYIGSPGMIDAKAQAFLVELPYAGARVNPHFHDVDQFQVVVAGNGRIGKKKLKPVTFQYADAYTPYGPIVANDDGISFFTLRNVSSGGHFTMPGSRHLMPCRAGRNIAGGMDDDLSCLARNSVTREPLMDAQADGVNAQALLLGAGASAEGLPTDAGGQYYLVASGSARCGDKQLGKNAVVRVEPNEPTAVFEAGPEGACVLALQFCRPTERPGSNPAELAKRDPNAYVVKTQPKTKQ